MHLFDWYTVNFPIYGLRHLDVVSFQEGSRRLFILNRCLGIGGVGFHDMALGIARFCCAVMTSSTATEAKVDLCRNISSTWRESVTSFWSASS